MENLIIIGDVHRKWKYLANLIYNYPTKTTFIQTGDFGIGFANKESDERDLEDLSRALKNQGSMLFSCRGNHDNPEYFNGDEIVSNVFLLKDYSRLIVDDKNILVIGGATSVDRSFRSKNKNYWEDETFKYNPSLIDDTPIDIMITHAGPEPLRPIGFGNIMYWINRDLDLNSDLLRENADFDNLDKILPNRPAYWVCGHFHPFSRRDFANDTNYIQLNELEFYIL